MRLVRGYGVLLDCECCFFSANLAQDVQLAATLAPDGPLQIIIDCVTPKINPFLSHLFCRTFFPSLPPSGPIIPSDPSPIKQWASRRRRLPVW